MEFKERPKIGVGVIVIRDGKVLLGKRKGAHGEGTWSFPGGHLEFSETIEDCAKREVMEETGMTITNLRKGTFTNDIFPKEGKHYVTLYVLADWVSGEPMIKEQEKCDGWEWFAWDNLPMPRFIPIENLLKEHYRPF
jgi:8-oxo-dGTP diphosphatase